MNGTNLINHLLNIKIIQFLGYYVHFLGRIPWIDERIKFLNVFQEWLFRENVLKLKKILLFILFSYL